MRGNIFSPESVLSNAISLLLLILALKRPVTAWALISILFIGAACFNGYTAIMHPETYMTYIITDIPVKGDVPSCYQDIVAYRIINDDGAACQDQVATYQWGTLTV